MSNRYESDDLLSLKPVFFLDLDGCLLTYRSQGMYSLPGFIWSHKCISLFNQFVKEFDPIIVISSNWRLHYSKQKLQQIFKINGIHCEISAFTKKLSRGSLYNPITRGLEIYTWMEDHGVNGQKFCVIDDTKIFYDRSEDCDEFYLDNGSINTIIKEHSFITRDSIGFDEVAYEELKNILLNKSGWKL